MQIQALPSRTTYATCGFAHQRLRSNGAGQHGLSPKTPGRVSVTCLAQATAMPEATAAEVAAVGLQTRPDLQLPRVDGGSLQRRQQQLCPGLCCRLQPGCRQFPTCARSIWRCMYIWRTARRRTRMLEPLYIYIYVYTCI